MIPAALFGLLAQDAPPAVEFAVPAQYRLIEGVASDGETVWLSSILDRMIVEYRKRRFRAVPMPKGEGAPLGIAWDAGRGWLWVAANCPDVLKLADCRTGLVAIDRSGKPRASLRPAGDTPFTPGDVSVWRDQVFVSDGANGAVYRCRGDCRELTVVIAPRQKGSAQGTVVYDGGKRLLVADYGRGLISVDLATLAETPVPLEDGSLLPGVDGMVADGDGFVGVRNASIPGKAWRFRISADNHVTRLEVAAQGGAIVDPTQIARAGDKLLIVADSQWSAYSPDKDGKVSGVQKPTPIVAIQASATPR
ncbi:hypothetical protein IAG41_04020 [Sphingomonas sp. JC676]|uniref:hypothetical protein n=1 Tax=Sphingomonas sp. JC676 TaxID=2768065 RepID=UPI0016576ABE|nr:hypothetical protein [Sphingomonas sp. JC676]MBC9031551.1 hypothetical protein [Sphingomonas sp. JC676]